MKFLLTENIFVISIKVCRAYLFLRIRKIRKEKFAWPTEEKEL